MNVNFGVYNKTTGKLKRTGHCQDFDFSLQLLEEEKREFDIVVVTADTKTNTHKVSMEEVTTSVLLTAEELEARVLPPPKVGPQLGQMITGADSDGKRIMAMWDGEEWRRVLLGEVVEVDVGG